MGWGYANLGGGGSGGGGLDLVIKSGPLEEKPVTAKGNFLYIVSDIPVKSYILSYLQPSVGTEGTYWLKIMHEGEPLLNLLKKNQLFLYLDSVYVCKNAKWEKCQAFLWHDGAWIEYRKTLVIFKATPGVPAVGMFDAVRNSVIRTDTDGSLVMQSAGGDLSSEVYTKATYRLDQYKTLHMRVSTSVNTGGNFGFISRTNSNGDADHAIAKVNFTSQSFSWIEIPLSNVGPSGLFVGVRYYVNRKVVVQCSDIWAE